MGSQVQGLLGNITISDSMERGSVPLSHTLSPRTDLSEVCCQLSASSSSVIWPLIYLVDNFCEMGFAVGGSFCML